MRPKRLSFRVVYAVTLTVIAAVALWLVATPTSSARPYGIESRVANTTLKMPWSARRPLGTWDADYAFPNLRFSEPVGLTHAPDGSDRLYVIEQRGTIQMFEDDPATQSKTLFLDISDRVIRLPEEDGHDETGALGLVFHPEFGKKDSPNRGYFYVYYTAKGQDSPFNRLSRFTVPEGQPVADVDSEFVLIDQPDPDEIHKAGSLQFGPDGFLYVAVGDGGFGDHDQKIDEDLFAGILRIDVDRHGGTVSHPPPRKPKSALTAGYFIPNDNPFVGVPNALEEFWAIGLRNPYRISFDRLTGQLWCGEPGAAAREQIELIESGTNHQWSYLEGTVPFRESYLKGTSPSPYHGVARDPVHEYLHFRDDRCVIGGYVYRGDDHPDLYGRYIYGDFVSGRIWALDYDGTQVRSNTELVKLVSNDRSGISSFGENSKGELFICYLSPSPDTGVILKLKRMAPPVSPELPAKLSETGVFSDLASLTPNPGIIPYTVNTPLWSDAAEKRRWISVPGDGRSNFPDADRIGFSPTDEWDFPIGTVFIKHFELPVDETNPTVTRRLETRLIVRDDSAGVYGVTYKWNDAQTDATLLPGSLRQEIAVRRSDGTTEAQVWYYPSREDCLKCHNPVARHILGVNCRQLNGTIRYPQSDVSDNQLRTWNHLGLFRVPLDEHLISQYPRLVAVDDENATLADRARSYLDSNCALCHRLTGGARAQFDTRYTMSPEKHLIGAPVTHSGSSQGMKIVFPGNLSRSLLYQRMNDPSVAARMPPLATNIKDQVALDVIAAWIKQLETGQ